jgi:predicted RNase H-like nuclease (RuvC/YqgF family)
MSEPKRYDCYILGGNVGDDPARSDGEFVRYEDYARLKAECQARQAENSVLAVECEHLKAEVDRLAMSEGYHYTAISINTLKEQLHQKHIDYIEARKANEAKVEMINSLKAEVERLTNNCKYLDQKLDEELDKSAMLCGQVVRLTKAGDAMAGIIKYHPEVNTFDPVPDVVKRWNAAKEGKQL